MNSIKHTSPATASLSIQEMTLSALMTAVLCILGPLTIPLPVSPVPLSFLNLALYLLVYVLDLKCSLLCFGGYFLLGAAGLPVYAGFSGGIGCVAGPTGGYLVGFFFQIILSAAFMKRWKGNRFMEVLGLILATLICYVFGTLWLIRQLGISPAAGITIGVLPYLPGDGVKIALASAAGSKIRKSLQKARH